MILHARLRERTEKVPSRIESRGREGRELSSPLLAGRCAARIRQAHRNQAVCLGDPVSPVLPLGGGRPRLLKSGVAMLNELYISFAFVVKPTIRLMFSGLVGRKNRLEAARVERRGRG